jgi:hypothetical protein
VIAELERRGLYHGETREDAALGFAAGAYMAGALPAVIMQNSGLGVSLNALGSLHIPLRDGLCLGARHVARLRGKDAPEHLVMGRRPAPAPRPVSASRGARRPRTRSTPRSTWAAAEMRATHKPVRSW